MLAFENGKTNKDQRKLLSRYLIANAIRGLISRAIYRENCHYVRNSQSGNSGFAYVQFNNKKKNSGKKILNLFSYFYFNF